MSGADGALSGLTADQLRAEVRAVLRDVLPPSAEEVALRTDADLDSFVRRVAALCDDPGQRAALQGGRRRFRLAGTPDPAAGVTVAVTVGVVRVDRGAVTERTVKRAAAEGARLVVGPRAVLTPLARDRARSLGIHVEREES